WSRRIVEASGTSPSDRSAALADHLTRMAGVEEAAKRRRELRQGSANDVRIARYYHQEASQMLARGGTGLEEAAPAGGWKDQTAGKDPRSRKVFERLEEPVSMSFPNETPLEDVLKYIKSATTSPKDGGIPIYVDPIGLQEAEKSMSSPV